MSKFHVSNFTISFSNFKISKLQASKYPNCQFRFFSFNFQDYQISKLSFLFRNLRIPNSKYAETQVQRISKRFNISDSQMHKHNIVQNCFHIFQIFLRYSGIFKSINKGFPGSSKSRNHGNVRFWFSHNKIEILLNQNEAE